MKRSYYDFGLWVCLLGFLIIETSLFAQGRYPIQNFPPSNYKGGIQNIDFVQNRSMTLFVANNLGVLSYNGKEWDLHTFEFGKKKRSLAFDENNNRLYVGLQGEFGFFSDEWNYISLTDKIPEGAQDFDEVWDVFCLGTKVYFCTFQGIYVYDGNSINVIRQDGGFYKAFLFENNLYCQNYNGELLELQENQFVKSERPIGNFGVISGLVRFDDQLFVIHQSGKIQAIGATSDQNALSPLSVALTDTYINHVLQLSDTRLSISTQTSGLFIYDLRSRTIEQIGINNGLLSNACLRSFQDYSGHLWVGMQNGIAMIDINSPMRFVNSNVGIQGSGYEAYETADGIYYTTSNGIYYRDKNSKQTQFLQGTEGPSYSIQTIGGKVYAGHHRGLFQLGNNRASLVLETKGIWEIKALQAHPNHVIGGSYEGIYLFRINASNDLEPIHKIEDFNESSRFFEEDKSGRIWVGQFYKGLYELTLSESLKRFEVNKISPEQNALVSEQILLSKIDNELYFATQEGVYTLDQDTDQIILSDLFVNNIGEQPVYLLRQDNNNNIHVYAENIYGVYKQISPNNYAFTPSSLFQLRYSFNNDLLNASPNTSDGIMINANEGFIHYNPDKEDRLSTNIPLVTSKVYSVVQDTVLFQRSIFGEASASSEPLVISYKERVLQFFIESFQLKDIENQTYQFFLEGFDENYGDWTSATMKEYTNLTEGDYTFRVRTINGLGNYIESEPVSFTITAPLYRRTMAKVGYFVIMFVSLFGIFRYQKNVYNRQTKDLNRQKQQELEENKRHFQAIERQNEFRLLQLKEEKMKAELVHLNEMLAASTMNLVVKNEFINSIKNKLNEVILNAKSSATKKALMKIEREIGTTLVLQEDWIQFEYHFNQIHGDFLTRIRNEFKDLSPNDQKLCAFLRLNLSSKEISNIMSVSQRGVEMARYRLRKKLNLSSGQNLSKFVLDY
ncbi:MAG: triple tyrosine motif-containing protein [Bacteroidota bacterium]